MRQAWLLLLVPAIALAQDIDDGVITQGLAAEPFSCGNLARECSGPARRFIEARCGIVTAEDGTRI